LIAEGVNFCWHLGETKNIESDKIDQKGTKSVQKKIEEVVSKNIQPSQKMIEGKAYHQKGAITASLTVNSTAHLGAHKKLRNLTRVFDKGISYNGMDIIMVKRILKRIGIGQKKQKGDNKAKKMIPSHDFFGSFVSCSLDWRLLSIFGALESEICLDGSSTLQPGHDQRQSKAIREKATGQQKCFSPLDNGETLFPKARSIF